MSTDKLCECGCGRAAPIASRTDRSRAHVKGQPIRYIRFHSVRMARESGAPSVPSRIIANGKLARILLCNGTATIVDAADVDLVKHLHWYPNSSKSKGVHYARANIPRDRTNGAVVTVLLHRLILGLPPGRVPNVDHANGNGLDNRRANIRVATAAQNKWNTGSRHTPKRTSRHKGVYFDRREGKWQAAIRVGACRKYLGTFRNEEAAVKAVREYTAVIHGEFAFERRTEGSATKTERVM